jgi:hypothetical protein
MNSSNAFERERSSPPDSCEIVWGAELSFEIQIRTLPAAGTASDDAVVVGGSDAPSPGSRGVGSRRVRWNFRLASACL